MRDDLLTHLQAARRDLVIQLSEHMDPEQAIPDAGYLRLLTDLQGAIAAIEAVMESDA
jgi:hypothetical protein